MDRRHGANLRDLFGSDSAGSFDSDVIRNAANVALTENIEAPGTSFSRMFSPSTHLNVNAYYNGPVAGGTRTTSQRADTDLQQWYFPDARDYRMSSSNNNKVWMYYNGGLD